MLKRIVPLVLLSVAALCPASVHVTNITVNPEGKPAVVGDKFTVDPASDCQLTAIFTGNAAEVNAGMFFYDQQGRIIYPHYVNPVIGTETVLTEAARKGSNSFKVADASKWLAPQAAPIAAFNAKKDLSDLPNRSCEYHIKSITRIDGGYQLELTGKLSRDYPVNTVIRQHRGGGWMNFNHAKFSVTPGGSTNKAAVRAVNTRDAVAARFWQGTAQAQFWISSSSEVTVKSMQLKKIPPVSAEPSAPINQIAKPFGHAKLIDCADGIAIEAVNTKSGFYSHQSAWDASKVKQLEFTVSAEVPGYLRFVCAVDDHGTRRTVNFPPHSIIPDGKKHKLIFDVGSEKNWQGISGNWELRWHGNRGEVRLHKITARIQNNLIPDLSDMPISTQVRTAQLQPLQDYKLSWEGEGSPNGTLRFFNRDLKEISGTAKTLSAQKSAFEFTVPEMALYSTFEYTAPSKGYARLTAVSAAQCNWRGSWIWFKNDQGPENHSVWFEKIVDLESAPEYAAFAVSADDISYCYINGRFAGESTAWQFPQRYEITKLLKPGRNRIVFRVHNYTQNAGLLADFYIKLANREILFATDSSWRCEYESGLKNSIPKDITAPVVILGHAHVLPWGNGVGYRYAGTQGILTDAVIKPGQITATVSKLPDFYNSNLHFQLRKDGKVLQNMMLPVSPSPDKWKLNQKITITYPKPVIAEGSAELYLNDDYIRLIGDPKLMQINAVKRAPGLQKASFVPGAMASVKLGNRLYPAAFWSAGTIERDPSQVIRAVDNGFRNYRIYVDFLHIWKGHGKFDFSSIDQKLNRLFSLDPDAAFVLQIYTHMPDWWLAENPDDTSAHYNNAPRKKDRDRQALASEKWPAAAEEPLSAILNHVKKSNYADRIWGVIIAENGNGEWFWGNVSGTGKPSWAGYSASDLAHFRKFLKKRYKSDAALAESWKKPGLRIDQAQMASPKAISTGSIGNLMDPARDKQTMDTAEFRNASTAESLIKLCSLVKKHSDGKLLAGAYYGYHTELAENPSRCIQLTGHNGFLEVAKSPYVDFVFAPSRYTYRKVGLADNIMQTWDSFTLRGKVVYVEQDQRNGFGPQEPTLMKIYVGQTSTGYESVGQINRALGMSLATGCAYYWFDIANGSFRDKVMNDILREHLELLQKLPAPRGLIPVETAVVGSRESQYYTRTAHADGIMTGAISGLFFPINNLAIPYRSMVVEDLLDDKLAVPAHKFYIMLPQLVLSAADRRKLMERFEKEKAVAVWLYAPGAAYPDQTPSAESCGDFLNIKFNMVTDSRRITMQTAPEYGNITAGSFNATSPIFYPISGFDHTVATENGQPVVVKKTINGATHYAAALTDLPIALYSKLLKDAGVHRFTEALTDPVWAGNDYVFLHAACGGKKSFRIPAGHQLRAIVGPYCGTLQDGETFDAEATMTYGFIMEKK